MCNRYEKNLSIWVNYEKKLTFISENELKKGDFGNLKVPNPDFSINQSPLSTIFEIVRSPGGPKFVLSGDPLYSILGLDAEPLFLQDHMLIEL